jgi:hypothetical protein
MEEWEKRNFDRLTEAIGEVELTERENRTLQWLSGCENSSIDNIISIFRKIRWDERENMMGSQNGQ